MSDKDWWEHFQAKAQDIKVGFLYWSVFVSQSHLFKPLSHLKLAKLSHWSGAEFVHAQAKEFLESSKIRTRTVMDFVWTWPEPELLRNAMNQNQI